MARIRTAVTTEGEIALVAATAKTILQLVAPAQQRIAVRAFSVSFDGTSGSAEPVQVDILRQTTAGTMSSATVVREDVGSETIQMTAQKTATAEPTAGDVLRRYEVHPQAGIEVKYGFDEELLIPGGGRLGLRVTAPANVNAVGHFSCEE
jgi:hypothetical protein